MKAVAVSSLLVMGAALVSAAESSGGSIQCHEPNGSYCAGDSLQTNIIVNCQNGVASPSNCNDKYVST